MTVSTIAQHVAQIQPPKLEPLGKLDLLREKYARRHGTGERYEAPDMSRHADIVNAVCYERGRHVPEDPVVAESYALFARHLVRQFDMLAGERFEFMPVDTQRGEYENSSRMMGDLASGRLFYLPTESTDSIQGDHPMLAPVSRRDSPGNSMLVNDVFRCVHDALAHSAGYGFGFSGEKGAWLVHRETLPRKAHLALWNETRGQNAWTNAGPHMWTIVDDEDMKPATEDIFKETLEDIRREARRVQVARRGEERWVHPAERSFPAQKCILVPDSLV